MNDFTDCAESLFNEKENEKAFKMIKQALKYFKSLTKNSKEYFDFVLKNLNSRALKILNSDDIEDSKFFFYKTEELLRIFKNSISPKMYCQTLNNISIWLRKAGQLKLSMEYLNKSQRISETNGIPYGIIYVNKAVVYSTMQK